jgi:hypothetical protein
MHFSRGRIILERKKKLFLKTRKIVEEQLWAAKVKGKEDVPP